MKKEVECQVERATKYGLNFFYSLICCLIGVANSQGDLKGQVVVKEAYSGGMDFQDLYTLDDRSLGEGHPVNDGDPL